MAGIIQLLKHRLRRDPASFDALDAFFELANRQWRDDLAEGRTETTRLEQGGAEDAALWTRVCFAELADNAWEQLMALPDLTCPAAKELEVELAAAWCVTVLEQPARTRLAAIARTAQDGPLKRAVLRATMRCETLIQTGLSWTKRTPQVLAQEQRKRDWHRKPPLRSFHDARGVDFVSLGAWVATLDRDTLHIFVEDYGLNTGNLTPLHAAISNPACDRSTALSLLAWCDLPSLPQKPDKRVTTTHDRCALADAIFARLTMGVFSPSTLRPAPEVAALKDWQSARRAAEQALRWPLMNNVFDDLGTAWPDPAYEVSNNGLNFRTPFKTGISAA